MATVVESYVGPNAATLHPDKTTYADFVAWWAAAPADFSASGGVIWRAKVATRGEWSSSTTFGTFSGKTCTVDCYAEIVAEEDYGFLDHPSKATNPLRYDATKGVAIRFTGTSGNGMTIGVPYLKMRGIQMAGNDTGTVPSLIAVTSHSADIDRCIFEAGSSVAGGIVNLNGTNVGSTIRNSLIVQKRASTSAVLASIANGSRAINCTMVSLGATLAYGVFTQYAAATIRNCYIGGVSAAEGGSGAATTRAGNYCNVASTGYAAAAMDTATFENVTAGTHDFRLKSGSPLIGAGTTDATYGASDIYGTARPSGAAYDVGAYEYVIPPAVITLIGSDCTVDGISGTAAVTVGVPPAVINLAAALCALDGTSSDGAVTVIPPVLGTISGVLKNNTGSALGNLTGLTLRLFTRPALSDVVTKTGVSTDAGGAWSVSDAALAAGTAYAALWINPADGALAHDTYTAS